MNSLKVSARFWLRVSLIGLVICSFANGFTLNIDEDWVIGNFTKQDLVNPILGPLNSTTFFCPVRQKFLYWEEKDVFNPTALVKDGKVHLLYRAEDEIGAFAGTSRIGLATSNDGLNFEREALPIFYPDNDTALAYEWEGGCEDPRIVEDSNGTYYMTYTAFDGELARLLIASSSDLRHWTKHGPLFGRAENGKYINLWSKSGSIVTELQEERFVAKKIHDKYWMYWGDTNMYAATSDNLIDWSPVVSGDGGDGEHNLTVVFGPRPGKFDSDLVEPGPQAFIQPNEQNILLIYNSRNKKPENGGDPLLPEGTYSAGQVLLNSSSPMQVLQRMDSYFMTPDKDYEIIGQVNNVVFVEGLVKHKNRWFLYYGTADSKIAVAAI